MLTVESLKRGIEKAQSKNEENKKGESKMQKHTFKKGQRINMLRETDLQVGVRKGEIISVNEKEQTVWIQIGKSNYLSKIDGKWLKHPMNLKAYCNTNIEEDLID